MRLFKGSNGEVIEFLAPVDETAEIIINGEPARELKAGTSDGAAEKHVPFLTKGDKTLNVKVGEVAHPMLDNHFITTIWAEYPDGTVVRKQLNPGEEPQVDFDIEDVNGKVKVYEYCNLHGLWTSEIDV